MNIPEAQIFIFIGLFTPGPNVILLSASGAAHGFRATGPHLIGVVLGSGILAGLVGLGVGQILLLYPAAAMVLRLFAFAWILFLALRIWQDGQPKGIEMTRPFTFSQAVLFQWINPKLWAVSMAASAFLIGQAPLQQAMQLGLSFSIINLFVCLFWVGFGHALRPYLSQEKIRKAFFRIMAGLLAASGLLVFT